MRAWLAELRRSSLQEAVARLVVKLDIVSRVAMPAAERLDTLRQIRNPLLRAVAVMPKPGGAEPSRNRDGADGLLLEQRLYCLMIKNLKQVLRDLDESDRQLGAETVRRRRSAVRDLFRFLGTQIELNLYWGQPLPPHTWRELHDLYAYCVERGFAVTDSKIRRIHSGGRDPEWEYKRLLLLGLAGRLVRHRTWNDFVRNKIASWVADTKLERADAFIGETGLYVVDTTKDLPPRQLEQELRESFRGWVLVRPSGFLKDFCVARVSVEAASRVRIRRSA
jgi:hypothetical protein